MSEKNIFKKQDEAWEQRTQSKGYLETLYVGLNGDNSDGLSWQTAFTTLNAAVDAASSDGKVLIYIGAGTFNVNIIPWLSITKRLHIKGSGIGITRLENQLGNSVGHFILSIEKTCTIENLTFRRRNENRHGAITYQVAAGGNSILRNCSFEFKRSGDPVSVSLITMGTNISGLVFEDLVMWGMTGVMGMLASTSFNILIKNVLIKDCNYGLYIDSVSFKDSIIQDCRFEKCIHGIFVAASSNTSIERSIIKDCTTGIKLLSGANKISLTDVTFTHCATNIDDVGSNTEMAGIKSTIHNQIYPEALTGVMLPNSGTPEVYGLNTVIIPPDAITKPFKILAFTAAPSDDKKFIVRLSCDGGVTYFMHMFERRDGLNGELSRTLVLHDTIFPKGCEISGSMMAEVGDETLEIWLYYQEI